MDATPLVSLLTHSLWAVVALYTVREAVRLGRAVWVKGPDAPVVAAVSNADVPDDLVAVAMQENEPWAQEELMRVIRERYDTYHDWNRVRASMGVGRRDDA